MLSVAPWFGTGITFFRELCYLTVVAFQRQEFIIIILNFCKISEEVVGIVKSVPLVPLIAQVI